MTSIARPLPEYLVKRYHGWKATSFEENRVWYQNLAHRGQNPRAMIIACCDSRVHVLSLFGADQGEFFIHRNVANLVPPYNPDQAYHGTSAAVEYAVTSLEVAHVIVMGHSGCGGVKGCYDMCHGNAPKLEAPGSFVGRWMDILRGRVEGLPDGTEDEQVAMLEKESVRVSLENLMTFPFVAEAVSSGALSLHGGWHDIGTGGLETLDPETDSFRKV